MFIGRELKTKYGLLDAKTMIQKTQEVFDRLELHLDPRTMVRELDASYKQIVEISRAMMMEASLIIMDEPTTSLTDPEIERVFDMMRMLQKQNVAIVFISHKLKEVMEVCNRYTVLRDGNMVAAGPVAEVTTADLARFMVGHDVRTENLHQDKELGGEILRGEGLSDGSHFRDISFTVHAGEVLGVTGLLETGKPGEKVIVDGLNGCLLLDPDADDLATYEERQREYQEWEARTRSESHWPAEMRDGVRVSVHANLERLEEMDELQASGAEGVGLYRTEFSFLREHLPSEEELYAEYSAVARKAAPAHVVFRTLDAGADKMLRAQEALKEPNPALGLRGIRFCLRHQKIFRSQLRALMRAGVEGNISLLLPMISGLAEVQSVRRIMQELQQELQAAGLPHAADLPLGIMVETPAAVLIADALARECDFFSIGTNDLIHYLMAIDRNNLHVGYLNEALHPAVVRSLKRIIDSAHREGIGVSVCGELAADPYGLALLLGMGVDTLSASPRFVPGMKHMIRRLDAQTCMDMAHSVLMSTDVTASQRMLRERLQESLGSELAFHTTSIMTNS